MTESTATPSTATTENTVDISDSKGLWLGIAFCVLFAVAIKALAPLLPPIAFAPDAGPTDYYWKLPNPDFLSRATAWGGYFLHQISIWACIAYAQEKGLTYRNRLHPVNIA